MPLVSVVVPIYNADNYLKEFLDSLWEQSNRPLEIILVDDGSTDLFGKICDSYSALSTVIKVVHTCNQGRTKARLTGVEKASGEYISFVDADDYIASTYVEHLLKCLFNKKWTSLVVNTSKLLRITFFSKKSIFHCLLKTHIFTHFLGKQWNYLLK